MELSKKCCSLHISLEALLGVGIAHPGIDGYNMRKCRQTGSVVRHHGSIEVGRSEALIALLLGLTQPEEIRYARHKRLAKATESDVVHALHFGGRGTSIVIKVHRL